MPDEYQSEAELEKQFMRKLNALGYKSVHIRDEQGILNHFRDLLNTRNKENLKDNDLSDTEFERVLNALVGSKTLYEIAQQLRGSDVQPYGKIVINRDDNSELYLDFFDGKDFENNIYEVTHQVTVNAAYTNRYDVTVLVNGLPIVQVELKRRDVDFTQAFNQVIRYRDESFRQLYRFVQLFVISNGSDTRYFANGDGKLNSNFIFYWTDVNNHWLNDIDAFSASFFDVKRLHSLIAKYTIFDGDHQRMMIMRPYQVYATEAIVKQAKEHPDENGYVWHTTGSGKTITSFKASRILAQETDAKKVIFLIDRSDLDIQTSKNFNSYLPKTVSNEPALDQTTNTRKLVEQLRSSDTSLIITTIQKMNNAIANDRYKDILTPLQDQRIIFIEDEAHRSQFGEMRKNVNRWFHNSQHFGFTGTPIFAENVGPDGRTTETLYNKELHKYLIKDAIRDHNVLGFSIQYINTINRKEELLDGNDEVSAIDTKEVLESDDRLRKIVKHIINNHNSVTHKKHYNAILTVQSTELALKYYRLFKELDPINAVKVTTIFTWAANEDTNEENQGKEDLTSRHGLDSVIKDYNQQYNTSFSTDNFKDYFSDVSKRMKEHSDATPNDNIDILIVVNMFLTGFDSPRLSTLYVDKKLQWHGLIQAFSRTNRVEGHAKPFGNIVAYRDIKRNTDDAVQLFSAGSSEAFFVPSYAELLNDYKEAVSNLHEVVQKPEDVDKLFDLGDDALKEFVIAFRSILQIHNKIRVYDDFTWKDLAGEFTDGELQSLRGKYSTVYHSLYDNNDHPEKASVLDDIDFELDLLAVDKIDVRYIVNLVKSINVENEDNMNADRQKIKRLLDNADSPELRTKAELLSKFLDEVVPTLKANDNVSKALSGYLEDQRNGSIKQFSEDTKVPASVINEQVGTYEFYGKPDDRVLNEVFNEAGYGFKEKLTLKKRVVSFIEDTVKKYNIFS
ncbi:type I restriction endonuclease subunit R [Pediococcus argentinicus]|uniref:Type I restriction enzyme endonuclease subunit n=1 Tax=Pediococcus argentinicus TaxID=480391 RepID=A0A0R2N8R7_9LACO|nr:type I restriction endonuclease subunit R [Pediococcus argentinicus]KRO21596.1 type i site-specific deoxyribonuclease, hsdr subunit [Pediococcus argentinicus]NKZ23129.1 type I restriction endonuclease subunit R [Pediococcus argentinicus]GEP20281.1 type I restriction-modification system,restriction subunit [Pediococcus argentinicus]